MSNRRQKMKTQIIKENRLEKKRLTVAEQEQLRIQAESKKRKSSRSLKVIRAVRKESQPTVLTLLFSVILNLFLGYGFTFMLTSAYSLPVNQLIFLPGLLLMSLGMSYCHAQKEKLTPILLTILLILLTRCIFMKDFFRINTQVRYVYSVLQQRVFRAFPPMYQTAQEIQAHQLDVTVLMLLLNFIPTFFTSYTVEKRRHIVLSMIWYIPFLFCTIITALVSPDALSCELAVTGILLLLVFQYVRRLGDSNADKRMLIITAPLLVLCLLIGTFFPQEGYTRNKLAASHFNELRSFMQEMGRRWNIGGKNKEEEENTDKHPEGYTGCNTFDEETQTFKNVSEENLSQVGFFNLPDQKILSITRKYNDTKTRLPARNSPMIYLRSTSMEVMDGNSWHTYSSGFQEFTHFYSEDSLFFQRESDYILRVNTYYPFDYILIPSYVDHFYISEQSQFADLEIEPRDTWNLQEAISNNGTEGYDYAYNMIPQNASPRWADKYLEEEIYGVCLQVPEKTREGILQSNKLPTWFKEVMDGTRTMNTAEKVNGVVDFVKNLHPYDINTPFPPEGSDFVTWFLTDCPTGFCVHYATTAAVLLRMLGVPTRYAIGYLAFSDPFVTSNDVSTKDAHAWFEFFDPTYGWVLDDATPGKTITASHYNQSAIAAAYEDDNYDLPPTPTPTPIPTPTLSPTKKPTRIVTPVPTSTRKPSVSAITPTPVPTPSVLTRIWPILRGVLSIMGILFILVTLIILARVLYILFWRHKFNASSLNKRAIAYNQYFNMHLYILESPGSRVARKIVQKAEYSNGSITEEELATLIRFSQHNLEIQIPGSPLLRRLLSRLLRIRLPAHEASETD